DAARDVLADRRRALDAARLERARQHALQDDLHLARRDARGFEAGVLQREPHGAAALHAVERRPRFELVADLVECRRGRRHFTPLRPRSAGGRTTAGRRRATTHPRTRTRTRRRRGRMPAWGPSPW